MFLSIALLEFIKAYLSREGKHFASLGEGRGVFLFLGLVLQGVILNEFAQRLSRNAVDPIAFQGITGIMAMFAAILWLRNLSGLLRFLRPFPVQVTAPIQTRILELEPGAEEDPAWTRPHRRLNPLTGEFVLVSPQRANRPWQGATESVPPPRGPSFDPDCFLCPGASRIGGVQNPPYEGVFVFPNDFMAITPGDDEWKFDEGPLVAHGVRGTCEVICYHPDHSLTLATMTIPEIRRVVDTWVEVETRLRKDHVWVQIFENRGEAMGMSSPHPHGQAWAMNTIPTQVLREFDRQRRWMEESGENLLLSVLRQERESGKRIVAENDSWTWLVPFWAEWPFEILLMPNRRVATLSDLSEEEKDGLASILSAGLGAYDRLFGVSFPYSMGWHPAPFLDFKGACQLHAHFYPPLLRSASVRKFRVGFEMLAEAQRDITPEEAADRLRSA